MTSAPDITPRFPHDATISVGPHQLSPERVIELLDSRLTDERRRRIRQVVEQRTCNVACVFDGPYDRGNVSAVLRTAEGLGIQPVHIIETQETFKEANRITQGAEKWLDIQRWEEPAECMADLAERGYQICATHLEAAQPIEAVDFARPTALVFGNESDGVSQAVLDAADVRCVIPMAGFSQSFNISVAAALTLYHVLDWRRRELGQRGDLTARERDVLEAIFCVRGVDRGEAYLAELLDRSEP